MSDTDRHSSLRHGSHSTRGGIRGRASTPTYRVELQDRAGVSHPVTDFYSSGSSAKQEQAHRINAFLAEKGSPRLVVDMPRSPWIVVISLLLATLTSGAFVFLRSEFRLDARCHSFTRIGWSLMPSIFSETLPLDQVRGISVVYRSHSSGSNQPLGAVVARLADGRALRLSPTCSISAGDTSAVEALESRRASLVAGMMPAPSSERRIPQSPSALRITPSSPAPESDAKICLYCGQDCGKAPRYRDATGRYMHQACHDRASSRT